MKSDAIRSGRLNQLLRMALNGADRQMLMDKAQSWVSKRTAEDYVEAVVKRIQVMQSAHNFRP